MKTIKLIITGIGLMLSGMLQAQAGVSVTVGTPPPWGPAEGAGVRFYYMPDLEVYFDVNSGEYVYSSGGQWIHAHELPPAYRHYDLYNTYKVPLREYHGEKPWENHKTYIGHYPKGYMHGHVQKTFKERPREHGPDKH